VTSAIVTACSIALVLMVASIELRRGHVRGQFDFLRSANAVYLMCFAVAPVYLQFVDQKWLRATLWSWMLRTPPDDAVFVYASILALVGYGFFFFGYWLAAPRQRTTGPSVPIVGKRYLWFAGLLVGIIGTIALVIYAESVGGWTVFLVEAVAFRGSDPPVVSRWAFLTNIAPLVIGAVLIFFSLRQYHAPGSWKRTLATLACAAFYVASLTILFHQAGRASFVAFLLTLPLIVAVQRDQVRFSHIAFGSLTFLTLVVFGRTIFQAARDPGALLNLSLEGGGVGGAARAIVLEFSFPIATLANAIRNIPDTSPLRWFTDFPLALAYLIPQRLTGLLHEPTVSMVNTSMFESIGGIPVDVLSLGYYSAALPGALLTAVGMGALVGIGERVFPPSPDPLRASLRVGWVIVLALRVMYADPQLFWRSGLYLLLTTFVVAIPSILRRLLPPVRAESA